MNPRVIVVFFLLLLLSVNLPRASCRSTVIHYNLDDEVDANTFVGNLATDASLLRTRNDTHRDRLPGLQFLFLSSPHSDLFHLDGSSGELHTNSRMDRDKICRSRAECKLELNVQIKAEHFSSFVKVLIKLKDTNDNPPVFSKQSVHLNISEAETVGRKFRLAHASDDDGPHNGIKRFILRPEVADFGIHFNNHSHDVTDGQILLELFLVVKKPLDREVRPTYQMSLIAEDSGEPPRKAILPLTVVVGDVNDNAPAFEREAYHAHVEENSPIGTSVLHLHARDDDLGRAGEVVYGLEKKLNPGRSAPTETGARGNDPGLTPFEEGHSLETGEEADEEEEEEAEWNVWTDEETGGPAFRVDRNSGLVYVSGSLDRESAGRHVISVSARDLGSARSKSVATVTIDVTDVNDNPPTLTSQFRLYNVTENCGPRTFVALVTVDDLDAHDGTRLACSSDDPAFALEPVIGRQFQLVTADSDERSPRLDRESRSSHLVLITCTDGGFPPLTGSLALRVDVLDRNDNAPRFESDGYSVRLRENHLPDTAVVRAVASDADAGDNGLVRYRLEVPAGEGWRHPRQQLRQGARDSLPAPNPPAPSFSSSSSSASSSPSSSSSFSSSSSSDLILSHLEVDEETGALKVVRPFDREQLPVVKLLLVAYDLGTPPQTSYADVVIFVDDVDDEKPIFTRSNFTFSIVENQPPDSFVGMVQAHDADEVPYNSFHFFIHRSDIFRLDPSTGTLTTLVSLDRELVDSYAFDVFACPASGEDDCTSAHVTVRIADENDNGPRLVFPGAHLNHTLAITNSFQYGDRVTRLMAEDDDGPGPNSRLVFRAVDTTYFRLNATSGMVVASRTFAVSGEGTVCEFPVVISDSGEPPRSLEVVVTFIFNSSVRSFFEAERGDGSDGSGESNFYIVVCIAVTSAFLSTVLVVAILLVARKQAMPPAGGGSCDADKKSERARATAGKKKKKDHKSSVKSSNASSLKLRCQQPFPAKGAKSKGGRSTKRRKEAREQQGTCNHETDVPFTLNNGYSRSKNKSQQSLEGHASIRRDETNPIGPPKHGPARFPTLTTPIPDSLMDDDGDSMFLQNMPEVVDLASTLQHPTSSKQRLLPQLAAPKMTNRPQVPLRAPGTVTLGCYGDRAGSHQHLLPQQHLPPKQHLPHQGAINNLRPQGEVKFRPDVVIKDPFYFTNCAPAGAAMTQQPTSVCFQNNEPKLDFGSFV